MRGADIQKAERCNRREPSRKRNWENISQLQEAWLPPMTGMGWEAACPLAVGVVGKVAIQMAAALGPAIFR